MVLAIVLILCWILLLFTKNKNKNKVTIKNYIIESKIIIFIILSTFFVFYVFGLMCFRLLNIQKTFNVYTFFSLLNQNFKTMSYFSFFANICLICSLILLIIFFINWYKNILFISYLQVHFFIISYYPKYNETNKVAFLYWHFDDEEPYESLKYLVDCWVVFCRSFFWKRLDKLPETKVRIKIQDRLYAKYNFYGFFFNAYFISFDFCVNKGNITKIFYAMLFIFFYYLLCKFNDVLSLYTCEQEKYIVSYIYFN